MPFHQPWNCLSGIPGREPSLGDLLADPITLQLMASDGLSPADVEGVLIDALRRSRKSPVASG